MAIRTVFLMVEDCAGDRRLGWREFVRDYAGIAERLLKSYFPTLAPEIDAHIESLFRRARESGWFSRLRFSNEREFMMLFRDLVFAYGREMERVPAPRLSPQQVSEIVKDQPLVERQMLWLFIKGYAAEQIAPIMLNAAATAAAVKQVADERLGKILPGSSPDAFTISARVLMEAAEASATPQCASLKTFNNIVNGQITWREKELAEEHMVSCFHCIDRFTTFLEMIRLRKDVPPLPARQVDGLVDRLGLPAEKSKGVLGRLFSRA